MCTGLSRAFNPAKYPDMDFPWRIPEVFEAISAWAKVVVGTR